LVLLTAVLVPLAGCVGTLANLINAGWGNKVPARFKGLSERRVAVVCVSKSSLFGPSSAAQEIARRVEQRLAAGTPEIHIIDQQTISDWIARVGWDEIDYRDVGLGVDAQMVIGIDIVSFSLYDGTTLYKGRSDIEVTVFDMDQAGKVVFNDVLPQIQFPILEPYPVTDVPESQFREKFLNIVADRIANTFLDHDRVNDFGRDPSNVGY
jgi:hypothetical protein